jgi:hypothetical protein
MITLHVGYYWNQIILPDWNHNSRTFPDNECCMPKENLDWQQFMHHFSGQRKLHARILPDNEPVVPEFTAKAANICRQ